MFSDNVMITVLERPRESQAVLTKGLLVLTYPLVYIHVFVFEDLLKILVSKRKALKPSKMIIFQQNDISNTKCISQSGGIILDKTVFEV